MPRKYQSPSATGIEIVNAMRSFENDLNLRVRWQVDLVGLEGLGILIEVWQDVNGVKIGIARHKLLWDAGDKPLLMRVLMGLHQAYWAAEEMAHRKMGK